jgi:hypothetical protein
MLSIFRSIRCLRGHHPRFLNGMFFYRNEVVSLMPQPPTWRTKVSLLVWPIAFDPSGMGGSTGNICYRRHGSQAHLGTPLRQSRDTSGGGIQRMILVIMALSFCSSCILCFKSKLYPQYFALIQHQPKSSLEWEDKLFTTGTTGLLCSRLRRHTVLLE